ncbi:thioesterase family protein [beta proteobacterium MWH-UniP1]
MARVKIDLPDNFAFSTEIPVYIGHINYGNHLDNAAMLSLVSEARMRFFASMGYSESNVDGVGIIVADAAIQYKAEVFYGDLLRFEMTATDFSRLGCDLLYRVTRVSDSTEVARGKTGIVFFDYQERAKANVPQAFAARFI